MRYFFLINGDDFDSASDNLVEAWASQRRETNVVHVPGGLALRDADIDIGTDNAPVKFCPTAYAGRGQRWLGRVSVGRPMWCMCLVV